MTGLPDGITIREDDWSIEGQSRSASTALSRRRQVVGALSETWRVTLTLNVPEEVRAVWRGWLRRRRGMIVPVRFGPGSDIVTGGPTEGTFVSGFDDGTFFSDGTGFSEDGGASSLSGDALTLDREITIAAPSAAADWREGFFFGIGGWLHEIAEATILSDDLVTITFDPPLRADYPSGTTFDEQPSTMMRLSDDAQGRVKRKADLFDRPTVELVELGP